MSIKMSHETNSSPGTHKQAVVVSNKLSIAYPYAPLEENVLDREAMNDQRSCDSSIVGSEAQSPTLTHGCAKTGLWGLKYAEEKTREEFMRFCHRSLDGAFSMLIYWMGGLGYALSDNYWSLFSAFDVLLLSIALVVEVTLHCWKRAGTSYRYTHAQTRHRAHVLAAMALVRGAWQYRVTTLLCVADPNYAIVTGQTASPVTRYQSCVRSIPLDPFLVVIMLFCTLRLDIYVHVCLTTLHFVAETIGLFLVVDLYPTSPASCGAGRSGTTLSGFSFPPLQSWPPTSSPSPRTDRCSEV